MPGIKTFTVSFLLAAASLTAASASDYLPLQQGNSWAYRSTSRLGTGTQAIEVQGKETLQNREYTKVSFFGRSVFLRHNDNLVMAFDPASNQESTWLDFGAEIGQSFPLRLNPAPGLLVLFRGRIR